MGVRWSRMSWAEKNELWHRWRRGETLDQIAQALHRGSSSIYDYVGAEGGIARRPRRRSRLALTTAEREEISRQLARGGLTARHRPGARSCSVHNQPRSRTESRAYGLPSRHRRSTGVATGAPSEGVSAGAPAGAASNRRRQTRAAVVASANLRLASKPVSGAS